MRQPLITLLAVAVASCAQPDGDAPDGRPSTAGSPPTAGVPGGDAAEAVRATLERAHALADSVEELLRPVPLMRPAEEEALRRYGQATQLPRARSLGARPADEAALEALTREGRLVPLEDSTRYWIVRDLRDSRALVTPDARALLERIGERFQDRLAGMGIPAYRLEITSVLRSAADQARLRTDNVNAARGTSTHEYGTTVDIAYSAFAPPAELPEGVVPEEPEALTPLLTDVARPVLESVSARKSRELMAILGGVLRDLQGEGVVLVTLERLQPVYHITVARRLTSPGS